MDVMMMVPADYAAANDRGKFSLIGAGFNELNVETLPCVYPLMFLFVRLKVTKQDLGRNKVEIRLVGEKGAVARAEINFEIEAKDEELSEQYINIPWQLTNLKFESDGNYEFEVEINGALKLRQLLKLKLIEQQPV